MARTHRFHWKQVFAISRQTQWILAEVAAALFLWEIVGRVLEFRPSILPTPSRILLEIWRQYPALQLNGQATFEEITLGILLSVLLAAPLAYLVELFPRAHQFAAPLLRLTRRAPLLVLAPVLFVWFTLGMLPKTLFVLLMAFPPAVEGVLAGLRSIPREMADLLRTMRAKNFQILFRLCIPGSLPGLFDGLRASVRLAVSGAAVAEFVASDQGLGYLMLSGLSKMDVPLVFASLAVLMAIAFALFVVVIILERIVIPWHIEIAGRTGVCCGRCV